MNDPQSILVISSSPRKDGNSYLMAEAATAGAREAGCQSELAVLDDYVRYFLRDCRKCRGAEGFCSLQDTYRALFETKLIPARGLILATPIHWYGMTGQLKTFFDRIFCYIAASHPHSARNIRGLMHKRIGLLLSGEETYPGAELGIVHQIQEYARYTRSAFVGVVRGVGNRRGDVLKDPANPIERSRLLGAGLLHRMYTDYRVDIVREASVWRNESP